MRGLLLLGLMLGALSLCAGCGGGDAEMADDTTTLPAETVEQTPVVPEVPVEAETVEPVVLDYASMDPAEYGIEDVFFAFDEFSLSEEAMTILAANARIMREHAELVYLVEGHCDERGTVEYNLALGEKRSAAVRDYLTSLGVPSTQVRITSYGEERPFAHGSNESAWALNRRGHFARP